MTSMGLFHVVESALESEADYVAEHGGHLDPNDRAYILGVADGWRGDYTLEFLIAPQYNDAYTEGREDGLRLYDLVRG